jgi:sulfoxide reductase heme-binding subunit YedZ
MTRAMNTTGKISATSNSASMFRLPALLKPTVFLLCLLPLVYNVAGVFQGTLGANPVEAILHDFGLWSVRLLLLTLCMTPLQMQFRWGAAGKLRRMLGLFAFFYALLHFVVWLVLDQQLNMSDALSDIIEKKYITVGMVALVGLLVLALTSNRWSVRKLGVRWKALHRVVYPLAVLTIVHYLWQVRANDVLEPAAYLAALLVLLLWRFIRMLRRG